MCIYIHNIPSSCTGFPPLSSSWLVTSTQKRNEEMDIRTCFFAAEIQSKVCLNY